MGFSSSESAPGVRPSRLACDPVMRVAAGGRLVYRHGQAPAGLRTVRQWRAERRAVPAGIEPVAYLYCNPLHTVTGLYMVEQTRPIRPVSERQAANLAAGRAQRGGGS